MRRVGSAWRKYPHGYGSLWRFLPRRQYRYREIRLTSVLDRPHSRRRSLIALLLLSNGRSPLVPRSSHLSVSCQRHDLLPYNKARPRVANKKYQITHYLFDGRLRRGKIRITEGR